jgi:hypothetical protein
VRIFVLGTGRCGTVTFMKACKHLTNYTSSHESRAALSGPDRFDYPANHIEADNRLAWFLGGLGQQHPEAYFVHLRRDREATAHSLLARWDSTYRPSIIRAFAHGILLREEDWEDPLGVCRFYVDTVTRNIDNFLAGRRHETVWLEEAGEAFPGFLERIAAQGDLASAVAEWGIQHNASPRSRSQ